MDSTKSIREWSKEILGPNRLFLCKEEVFHKPRIICHVILYSTVRNRWDSGLPLTVVVKYNVVSLNNNLLEGSNFLQKLSSIWPLWLCNSDFSKSASAGQHTPDRVQGTSLPVLEGWLYYSISAWMSDHSSPSRCGLFTVLCKSWWLLRWQHGYCDRKCSS